MVNTFNIAVVFTSVTVCSTILYTPLYTKGVFFVIQLRTTRDIEFYKALFTTCKLVRDIGQRSPNS